MASPGPDRTVSRGGEAAAGPVLLACDLDGTLLDHEGAPVPGVGEAIAGLVGAGAVFVVVTGRPLQAARRATAALGVEPTIYACYHGALIADRTGTVLRQRPLPRRDAEEMVAEALSEGVGVTIWDVDEPREAGPGTGEASGSAAGTGASAPPSAAPPGDRVSRLVLHGEPAVIARLLSEMREEWAGRLQVKPIRPGFIGVFAPGVDKGEALSHVAARLDVPLERTVACGDGAADETLLAAAAVRIAVGRTPHVLERLPGVMVSDWERLPDVLRSSVLSLI